MKFPHCYLNLRRLLIYTAILSLLIPFSPLQAEIIPAKTAPGIQQNEPIISAKKVNATTIELSLADNHRMLIDFYGDNIFRGFPG